MGKTLPVGARTFLNEEAIEKYCSALSIGSTHRMASAYISVSHATTINWRNLGAAELERRERGDPPDPKFDLHVKFAQGCEIARQEAGVRWVQVVNAAANDDPEWAWKMLQNSFPDDFKPPTQRQDVAIVDWRKELQDAGFNPDDIERIAVGNITKGIRSNDATLHPIGSNDQAKSQ